MNVDYHLYNVMLDYINCNIQAYILYVINANNTIHYIGYIPQEWKLANVVPVHKKDDKNKVTNYRPISLTKVALNQ